VVPNFCLRRKTVSPIRIRHEGQRVQMRLHITSAAGIGIIAPHTPDIIGALKDYEIFKAFLLQPDRGSYTAEAAADDCYLHVLHLFFFRPEIVTLRRPSVADSQNRSTTILNDSPVAKEEAPLDSRPIATKFGLKC